MAVSTRQLMDLPPNNTPSQDDWILTFTDGSSVRRSTVSSVLSAITNSGRIQQGVGAPTDPTQNTFDTLWIDTLNGGVYYKITSSPDWVQIATLDVISAIRTWQEFLTADLTLPDSYWFYTVNAVSMAAPYNLDMPDNPQDGMTVFVITDGSQTITVRDENDATITTLAVAATTQLTYDAGTTTWTSNEYTGTPGPQGPTGATGPAGPAGADGADGIDGDQWVNAAADPVDLGSPNTYDTYHLNTLTYDLFKNTAGATTWANIGNIQGAQGIQGDPGPAGADGQDALGNIASVSSNFSVTGASVAVFVDASSGPVTITLPNVAEGGLVNIKKTDSSSNAVTIVGLIGTEPIDGVTSQVINLQYESITVKSDGFSNWWII